MKRLFYNFIILISCVFIFNSHAVAASSATQAHTRYGNMNVLVISWTADTDGSFTDYETQQINGIVSLVETDPGSTAPTASYDITIKNSGGIDIMGGKLVDRSATATEFKAPYDLTEDLFLTYPVKGPLTIAISNNSVNSATGTVTIYYFDFKKD